MYSFNALTQKIIIVTQQLFGASSQDRVSTAVGHFHPNSPTPTFLIATSEAISITKPLSIIPTIVHNNI